MRWKQFFTPVKSISPDDARQRIATNNTIQIVDVRQPTEYEEGHISGAKLLPLGDLPDLLDELDPAKDLIVYCAIGGRSRIAAQMLSGKGFKKTLNLTGGFKAWQGWVGYGDFEQGLEYFSSDSSISDILAAAYGMEKALGDFYLRMAEQVRADEAASLFSRLASIESKHSHAIANRYAEAANGNLPPEPTKDSSPEGGMTIEEYMKRLGTNPESAREVVEFAMALEAQAMDLYSRAATWVEKAETKAVLTRIGQEERGHLQHLAKVMDQLPPE